MQDGAWALLSNNCLKVHRVPGELTSGGSLPLGGSLPGGGELTSGKNIWKDPHSSPSFPQGEEKNATQAFKCFKNDYFFSRTRCSCWFLHEAGEWQEGLLLSLFIPFSCLVFLLRGSQEVIALQPCKAYSTQDCTCSDLRPLAAASSCLLHFWLQGDFFFGGEDIFQPKWLFQDATKSSNPCPSQAFEAWGKGLENSPGGSKHPQRGSNLHNRQEGRGCAEERRDVRVCSVTILGINTFRVWLLNDEA